MLPARMPLLKAPRHSRDTYYKNQDIHKLCVHVILKLFYVNLHFWRCNCYSEMHKLCVHVILKLFYVNLHFLALQNRLAWHYS